MMRLVHAVLVGTIAVGVTGWPASVAYSTGQMTQKQAALQGLTVTRKTPDATVDKLIVQLRTGKSPVQATAMTDSACADALAKSAGTGMKSLRSLAGGCAPDAARPTDDGYRGACGGGPTVTGPGRRVCRAECPVQEDWRRRTSRASRSGSGTCSHRPSIYTGTISAGPRWPRRPSADRICRRPGT